MPGLSISLRVFEEPIETLEFLSSMKLPTTTKRETYENRNMEN